MDVDRLISDPLSRRALFRGSGVAFIGGAATFVGACGEEKTPEEEAAARTDVEILNSAIDLENMAIAAYTAGAPLLKREVLRIGRQFLTQEKEHADALEQAVRDAGGRPSRPKAAYNFPAVKTQTDVLNLANMLENVAVAAYIDAIPKLSSGDLRATAAAIVTNEAEHISVLLGALGRPDAPSAFVTGKR